MFLKKKMEIALSTEAQVCFDHFIMTDCWRHSMPPNVSTVIIRAACYAGTETGREFIKYALALLNTRIDLTTTKTAVFQDVKIWQKFSDSGGKCVNFYKITSLTTREEYNLKIYLLYCVVWNSVHQFDGRI